MLGEENCLDVTSAEGFTALFIQAHISRMERSVIFDEAFLAEEDNPDNVTLLAPIEEGEPLGRVTYTLDGAVIFEGEILATATVEERNLDSDMDFYIALIRENIFSVRSLPFWLGGSGVLIGIAGISLAVSERRRSKRSWYGRR
jgi:hypothetical protein